MITGPKDEVSFDEPMANSSIVELAEHHRAVAPQVGGDGRLVGRHEVVEDVRAGGGAHALGAEQVLDRRAECLRAARASPVGEPRVGGLAPWRSACSGVSSTIGVERARLLDRGEMRVGQLGGGDLLLPQPVARLRQRERGQLRHSGGTVADERRGWCGLGLRLGVRLGLRRGFPRGIPLGRIRRVRRGGLLLPRHLVEVGEPQLVLHLAGEAHQSASCRPAGVHTNCAARIA